ncbi:unnamed protein product [Pedinophyceae sp. YPF-701]|nr:unnamed protein product [Pedinophyceae sp. YPF-701]
MTAPDSIAEVEAICQALYTAHQPAERAKAENAVAYFTSSVDAIPDSQKVLEQSSSPYAQHMAASAILQLITEVPISPQGKLELRGWALSLLYNKGPTLEAFVLTSLLRLLARVRKLGWFEDDQHRKIVDDARKFKVGGTEAHAGLALRMLATTVNEFNQPTPNQTIRDHRKTAVSMRDNGLLAVFQLAVEMLQSGRQAAGRGPLSSQEKEALLLCQACLSYDFVCTSMDESTEDLGTIQIPSSWRSTVEDATLIETLLVVYHVTTPPESNTALDCLVRLASVRRSLFTGETERIEFLRTLVEGTLSILRSRQGLQEHPNYHEFCRLLGRLRTNFQLSEVVSLACYSDWIVLVADLTIGSLNSWLWVSTSVYYLLGLWSRFIASVPYLKGDKPAQLDTHTPNIIRAYVTSRLESVQAVLQNPSIDNPLDDNEQVQDQMEAFAVICRYQYEQTAMYITSTFQPLAQRFAGMASQPLPDADATLLEGQLTWLVHIIGSVVRGRQPAAVAESQESIDGELASQVFGVLKVCDTGYHAQRAAAPSRHRLERALMSFFQAFRKVYVGEQAMQASKVFRSLGERVGLTSHEAVLAAIVAKIGSNLRVYGAAEAVVQDTLELFRDLSDGYMSGKLLLKLDSVTFMLQNHSQEHFGFLGEPGNARNRTMYYATLARLLFTEDSPKKFRQFVRPFQQLLGALQQTSAGGDGQLRQAVPAQSISGLFRDLRGIVQATSSARTYLQIFEWLYPQHFPTIMACLKAFAGQPEAAVPLLKFIAEFALNKTQRLSFDSSSPNGILLFREVSRAVVIYGTHVLSLPPPADIYQGRYKGTWVALLALTRALGGNYVNFGVFELYNDPALKDALAVAFKLALAIPLRDVLAYNKLAKTFFAFIEVLCHKHTRVVAGQDSVTFQFVMAALQMGLQSLDVYISSQSAAALDNLTSFYFKAVSKNDPEDPRPTPPEAQQLCRRFEEHPDLIPSLIRILMESIMFRDVSNQWALSRPLLPLILINGQAYQEVRSQLLQQQVQQRRAVLSDALERLTADVQQNLDHKNRDRFTQNITCLLHNMRVQRLAAAQQPVGSHP